MSMVGVLWMAAGALGIGCGGPELESEEPAPLQGAEQELRQCGQGLPACPTGQYCTAYPRGVCMPNVID
ncbi:MULTISPECIES: hypothetical protein [Corallococcus]|uniref:hypothetical protein n=1 Tax=Corallococcus TaxID=83461 RepID=UPI001376E456|nr:MULTISPECIES: hypothetical protein [Corallococcus]NBD08502.1 hypothetical protein [Corallococcus silvisoli]